ncbi:hypothetical protein GCM10010437_028600 [Actinoplanes palleronii]
MAARTLRLAVVGPDLGLIWGGWGGCVAKLVRSERNVGLTRKNATMRPVALLEWKNAVGSIGRVDRAA